MAVNKKSNLLECIFISKKSLEISLNLTSQIKQLSLTHFVLIVTEPNLEAQSFYSEYRGILDTTSHTRSFMPMNKTKLLNRVGHWWEPHVFRFLIRAFVFELWPQTWGTSIHRERNKKNNMCNVNAMLFHWKFCLIQIFFSLTCATSIFYFKWLLPFPVEIYPFEIFTRATPGSSLVKN